MHARECILLCSLFFQVTYYSHSKMQRRPPGFYLGLKVGGGFGRVNTPQNGWPLPHLLPTPPITC